jgi:hypothetical protein
VDHWKLEKECAGFVMLSTCLGKKKSTLTDHEAEIATANRKYRDYQVGHRKRLRVNLEKAENEISMRCLPYSGKNSAISKVIAWFDEEI